MAPVRTRAAKLVSDCRRRTPLTRATRVIQGRPGFFPFVPGAERPSPRMIDIGQSGVHGMGAFAAKDLVEGDRIGVYEGRRYTAH